MPSLVLSYQLENILWITAVFFPQSLSSYISRVPFSNTARFSRTRGRSKKRGEWSLLSYAGLRESFGKSTVCSISWMYVGLVLVSHSKKLNPIFMRLTSASLSGHRPVSWSTGQQWQNQGLKGTSMADWSRIWNLFTSNFVWKECLVFPQASQGHVTSVDCKCTLSQESRCRITGDRWDVVWEIKHWGLQTFNIIILYLFFYKINKGDLPLMYSCVLWEEFIDLVVFLAVIVCPLSLVTQ